MRIYFFKRFFRFFIFTLGYVFIVGSIFTSQGFAKNNQKLYSSELSSPQYEDLSIKKTLPHYYQEPDDFLINTLYLQPWDRVNTVLLSSTGKLLAAGSPSGVHVFDFETFEEIRVIKTDHWVRSLALTSDDSLLAAGVFDHTIQLWEISSGTLVNALEGHTDWVRSVVYTSDNTILASASDDDTVRLWRVSDGKVLRVLNKNTEGVRSIAFSPDNTILAVGTQDGTIYLWDVQDGMLLNTLKGHRDWVRALEFSHSGEFLASGAFDATARIWRVSDGALVNELNGHTSSVLSVSFSLDDNMLITGSVDTTIRLWSVIDGHSQGVLTGHTDFVYDTEISSDGDILISSSEDATIRIWDLSKALFSDFEIKHPNARSGDCRTCHHPASETKPPLVLELRCEACHSGGAGLNWCPVFPPLLSSPYLTEGNVTSVGTDIGLPLPGDDLSITIAKPGNGEAIYSNPAHASPVRVTGKVSSQKTNLSDVSVYLEIWFENEKISMLPAKLLPDGSFSVDLGLNPDGTDPVQSATQLDAGAIVCDGCHTEYEAAFYLPEGDIQLVVWASAKEAKAARDDRWVTVDVSTTELLEVTILDDATGEPATEVSVQALTRLYEWRPRNFSARTNERGIAAIELETLSRASTTYLIEIPSQIVNGTHYVGVKTVEINYQPGTETKQTAVIRVKVDQGEIQGQTLKEDVAYKAAIDIWAVQLPSGRIYQTKTNNGQFSFNQLPIAEYMILSDIEALNTKGLISDTQRVDLANVVKQELDIHISSINGIMYSGEVIDEETDWLPFAWVETSARGTRPVDLSTGTWNIQFGPEDQKQAFINAPGYYSQEISFPIDNVKIIPTVSLERHLDTHIISWPDGEILIPAESSAIVNGDRVRFETGWMWGNGNREEPFIIALADTEVRWFSGRFALEHLPNQTTRFYLLDGVAEIITEQAEEKKIVLPGTVVTIQENGGIEEASYNSTVFSAFHTLDEAPLARAWKLSSSKILQNSAIKISVGTAQLITFITYVLILLSVVGIPVTKIYSEIRRRNRPVKKEQDD